MSCSRTASVLKSKSKVKPLLYLQYNYSLNKANTKVLSIGYTCDDFQVRIVIENVGKSFVVMTPTEWLRLGLTIADVESFFEGIDGDDGLAICCSKNVAMKKFISKTKTRFFVLQNDRESKVFLDSEEWKMISSMYSFIAELLIYMKKGSEGLDTYYSLYLFYCIANGVQRLESNSFFCPFTTGDGIYFNYSRFFWEIGFLNKRKLQEDVANYQLNVDFASAENNKPV